MKHNVDNLALVGLRDVNRLPVHFRYGTDVALAEASPPWSNMKSKSAIGSIMVPFDGSRLSEHALPIALRIAGLTGASIRLVHVHTLTETIHDTPRPRFAGSFDVQVMRERFKYLRDIARRLEIAFSVRVLPTLIESQDIWDSISTLKNVKADLVVMATHDRGRFGNWFWDSVANKLTNHATVPHLFVRGSDTRVDLKNIPSLEHILVPLDGSKKAESALFPATALANIANSNCTLLQVITSADSSNGGPVNPDGQAAASDNETTAATGYLEEVRKSLVACERTIRTRAIRREKSIAASILDQSIKLGADVIAVTSRARSPLSRLFRPSMAERLLHKGNVPVLVCPQMKGDL